MPLRRRLAAGVLLLLGCWIATPLKAYTPIYSVKANISANSVAPSGATPLYTVVAGLNKNNVMAGYVGYQTKSQGLISDYLAAFVWDDAAQTLTTFNNLVASTSTMATCINDAGYVAGVCWTRGVSPQQLGFVYQNGSVSTFQSPEGGDIDTVIAINASGQAIATYFGDSGLKRAFLWDGNNATDLGDFGDPDESFVWPQGINDAGQVTGTVYIEENGGPNSTVPSIAFVWQNGTMNAVDGSGNFANTIAQAIDSQGNTIGTYLNPSPKTNNQVITGGFYGSNADGTATALDDPKIGGRVPFYFDINRNVYGVVTASDGSERLFEYQPGGTLTDFGSATINSGDANFQMTTVNDLADIGGFITDASGDCQPFLHTQGTNYNVSTLLLSSPVASANFSATSNNGTLLVVNHAELVACAGISQNQPTILLLTQDCDGNGLPDGWEEQYFHTIGVNPLAPAPNGSGLSILACYQQGIDPIDYYNGVAPSFQIVSGNNQRAAAGTVLPEPLLTLVTDNTSNAPLGNAPVTYQVTAGVMQIAASAAGPWGSSCSVVTDAAGHAAVYCQVPAGSSASASSTIQASAGTATPVLFTECVLATNTAAGLYHTLAVDASGAVWSWGKNNDGQLGNGSTGNLSFAGQVTGLPAGQKALAVAAGDFHSLALMGNGTPGQNTVWAWGSNTNGQLGNGNTSNQLSPVEVMMAGANGGEPTPLTGIVAIAAGSTHSLAVDVNGAVWAWGSDYCGELGNSNGNYYANPLAVPVPGLSGMTAVAGGLYFSVALRGDGTAWAWGNNDYGELGIGTYYNASVPTEVSNASATVAIAAGAQGQHLLLLQSNGTVLASGDNVYGQLGDNNPNLSTSAYPVVVAGVGGGGTLSGVVGIAAGANHSLALLSNGNAVAWGSNTDHYNGGVSGQLGNNATANSFFPVAVATTSSSGSNNLSAVGAGGSHSTAIIGHAGIPVFLGWGSNTLNETDGGYSTLADGSTPSYYLTPIIVQFPQALVPAVGVMITSGSDGTPTTPASQPVAVGNAFTRVYLPLDGSGQAASATMTVSYGSAWAGQAVWIQPLRGGTCTSPAASSSATFQNGMAVTLDANGAAVLNFQPPNKPGAYKVATRLLNAKTIYSFVVPVPGS